MSSLKKLLFFLTIIIGYAKMSWKVGEIEENKKERGEFSPCD
jgi:hypothetical protein